MPPTFSKIQVGIGGPFQPVTTTSAHADFAAALALLSPAGGELIVYPAYDATGSSPVKYLFGASVSVTVPNVTLLFAPGAVLDFAGTAASEMFLVTAPGFRAVGAVVDHLAVQKDGRSCFRVQQPSGPGADTDEASFVNCRFRVGQSSADVLGFSCIRSEGQDSRPRRGLQVRGCSFDILAGTASAAAWQGNEPYGICAVRATATEGCQIYENRFQGPPGSAKGPCGPMVLLDGCERSVIASNVFDHLDLVPAPQGGSTPSGGSVLRLAATGTPPGHPVSVCGNVFHAIDCRHVIESVDTRYDSVTANHFGSVGPHCDAVLRARGSGKGLTVFGNVFQEVCGGGVPATNGHMLHLSGLASATIDGNVLTGGEPGRRLVEVDPASCSNVHVGASQVLRSRTT